MTQFGALQADGRDGVYCSEMADALKEFIGSSKAHGVSDQTLIELLRRQGWSDRQVFSALQAHYEQQTGLKLPARASSWESARDAFVYLLSFIALCAWVWSSGSLWFTLIDIAFPDPLTPAYYGGVRYSLASALSGLIVGLPVYLVCLRTLSREVARNPDKLDSGIRKWLTYMAMLIAAGVIFGDLISFLNHFLRGELSVRFVLKSLTVLALASAVLWYHLGSVGAATDPDRLARRDRVYMAALIALAVVSLGAGFLRLGTPGVSRAIEADLQRSRDLREISGRIRTYWMERKQLPPELSAVSGRASDPITRSPYTYRQLSGSRYELCAQFSTAQPASGFREETQFAQHSAGEQCFTVDAAAFPR